MKKTLKITHSLSSLEVLINMVSDKTLPFALSSPLGSRTTLSTEQARRLDKSSREMSPLFPALES